MLVTTLKEIKEMSREYLKFEREVDIEFECKDCHKITKIKLRSAKTKEELICKKCQAKQMLATKTMEENIETDIKRKKTCLDRYGVEHPLKSKKIVDKRKKTCEKTGALLGRNSSFKDPLVQAKCKKTRGLT
jgi:hypothetical protein